MMILAATSGNAAVQDAFDHLMVTVEMAHHDGIETALHCLTTFPSPPHADDVRDAVEAVFAMRDTDGLLALENFMTFGRLAQAKMAYDEWSADASR